jgi:hypothetical protein
MKSASLVPLQLKVLTRREWALAPRGGRRSRLAHRDRARAEIAWQGTAKTTRASDSFELRRALPDLPGADTVTATAWGPRGTVCRVGATLSSTSTR